MKYRFVALSLPILLRCAFASSGAEHYVDLNCANPVSPYLDWTNAATNIQDAIDAAAPGDLVRVTNGVYRTGGRLAFGALTNRVVILKAITVQSVNGPAVTAIEGNSVIGDSAVRCVYMTNDAILSGFTLTNGGTRGTQASVLEKAGGGVISTFQGTVTNCIIVGNFAAMAGGAIQTTLSHCVLSNNTAFGAGYVGGGAWACDLTDCTLAANKASWGGGASLCSLSNCTLINNTALSGGGGGAEQCNLTDCLLVENFAPSFGGGGATESGLNHCTFIGNSALFGGGANTSDLTNCVIMGNSATDRAGGVNGGNLYNCIVVSNTAPDGGGARFSFLYNCTIVGNSAAEGGGVGSFARLTNCIVYYNTAQIDANCAANIVSLVNCCTTPLPGNSIQSHSITNPPLFVDLLGGNLRLQTNSPCINAGHNAAILVSPDLDGGPRTAGNTVDIGAYEMQLPSSTISYAWLQEYGLPTDGSADYSDTDSDGLNNWQEWQARTIPIDALSVLKMLVPSNSPSGLVLQWQSVSDVTYFLQRSTNLSAALSFVPLQNNIAGQAGTTTCIDSNAVGPSPFFYRVGLQQ